MTRKVSDYRVSLNIRGEDNISAPAGKASKSVSRLRNDMKELSSTLRGSGGRGVKDFESSLDKLSRLNFQHEKIRKASEEMRKYFSLAKDLSRLKLEDRALGRQISDLKKQPASKERLTEIARATKRRGDLSREEQSIRKSAAAAIDRIGRAGFDTSSIDRRKGFSPSEAKALTEKITAQAESNAKAMEAEEARAKSSMRRFEMEARIEKQRQRNEKKARQDSVERHRLESLSLKERMHKETLAVRERMHNESLALREKLAAESRAERKIREERRRTDRETKEMARHARQQHKLDEIARSSRVEALAETGRILGSGSSRVNDMARQGMTFERALSQVRARLILPEIDPSKDPKAFAEASRRIRDEAIGIGKETGMSPTTVLSGYETFAKAGFQMKDIDRSTVKSLAQTSLVGGMDISGVVDLTAGIIQSFNKNLKKDMIPVANALASVSDLTQLDMSDLAYTFKYAAPYAQKAGASFEQTATFAALLGKGGIKGEMAGTSLRNFFTDLAVPKSRGRKALADLNVDVDDDAGNLRDPMVLVREIADALNRKNLGSAERLKVADDLMGKEGGSGFLTLLEMVNREIEVTVDGQTKMMNQYDYMISEISKAMSSDMVAKKAAVITGDLQGSVDRFKASTEGLGGVITNEMSQPLSSFVDQASRAIQSIEELSAKYPGFARAIGYTGVGAGATGGVLSTTANTIMSAAGLKLLFTRAAPMLLGGGGAAAGAGAAAGGAAAGGAAAGAGAAAAGGGLALGTILWPLAAAAAVGGLGYGAYKLFSGDNNETEEKYKAELQALGSQAAARMDKRVVENRATATIHNTFNLYGAKETDQKVVDEIKAKIDASLKDSGLEVKSNLYD